MSRSRSSEVERRADATRSAELSAITAIEKLSDAKETCGVESLNKGSLQRQQQERTAATKAEVSSSSTAVPRNATKMTSTMHDRSDVSVETYQQILRCHTWRKRWEQNYRSYWPHCSDSMPLQLRSSSTYKRRRSESDWSTTACDLGNDVVFGTDANHPNLSCKSSSHLQDKLQLMS